MDMGKAIILKKKDGEKVYPISASDLIFDPVTKKHVKQELAEKIGDAPSDGKQYARINGGWGEVDIPESGIGEAPKDGMQYVRKDGKWERISPDEICQITLKSNQGDSDAASLIGASVKIVDAKDGSELYNGTWNGETIILGIKQGTEYKIVAGGVESYAAPAEQTYTAAAFVNRDVEMIFNTELVRVILSADNSSSVNGQIVTINGEAFTYGSTAVEKKVPFGTEYSVSVNEKSGYITPASQTFTAAKSVRDVAIAYSNDDYGVYIQSIDGGLYTVDRWDETKTPNGIAVIADKTRFVVSLTTDGWQKYMADGQNPFNFYDQYLTSYTDVNKAKADYNGPGNTTKILKIIPNKDYAAGYCNNYVFPNGKKGYLPSLGQMNVLYENKTEVVAALTKVGGEQLVDNGENYKTSTLGTTYSDGSGNFWVLRWQDGHSSEIGSSAPNSVRPFTSI